MTLMLTAACNSKHEVQVAPLEVKPIHITIDVNIKVDRALEDFFGDLDKAAGATPAVRTAPAPSSK
ncbi:MAG: hypothetical protein JXR80_04450 [Deltaproteobacteria bacterium]|nr:hypothetical protein [Deltaproteobacteria bacterium]